MKMVNSVFLKKTQIICSQYFLLFPGYPSSYLIGYWLVDWQVWKTLEGSSLTRTGKAIYIPWSNLNTLKQPPLTLNTPSCSLRLYNLLKAQTKFSVRMSPSTKKKKKKNGLVLFQWVQKNFEKNNFYKHIYDISTKLCMHIIYTE